MLLSIISVLLLMLKTSYCCMDGKTLVDNLNLPENKTDSYCANLIIWSISNDSFVNHNTLDI